MARRRKIRGGLKEHVVLIVKIDNFLIHKLKIENVNANFMCKIELFPSATLSVNNIQLRNSNKL